jgi:hypothetical protein
MALHNNLSAPRVCYVCDVPLEVCSKFLSIGPHHFNYVVATACLQAFHSCPEKLEPFDAILTDALAFAKWLGGPFTLESHETSRAVAVFGLVMSAAAVA